MKYHKKGANTGKLRKRAVQGLKYSVKWGSGGMHKEKNQCFEKMFLPKKGTFIYGKISEVAAAPSAPHVTVPDDWIFLLEYLHQQWYNERRYFWIKSVRREIHTRTLLSEICQPLK